MAGLRANQLALYVKDMYKAEREGYKEVPTVYDRIFSVKTGVKGAGDKKTQVLGAGRLERHETEGQDVNFKSPIQGWEYLVKYWTYSDGITLTKEAVEDTVKLGNLLKELAATWGKQNRIVKETMASTVFNHGGDLLGEWVFNGTHTGNTDSSGDLMYDSKPLFNLIGNTRTTKGGGTYYNSSATYATMTPGNFEGVYNLHTVTNAYDERDEVVQNPADTVLVPPGSIYFKAERIFNTTKGLPGGQMNDINPYLGLITGVIDWRYLTDYTDGSTEVFYVGKRKSESFQFHERQYPELRFFRDENNLGYKVSNNLRCGVLLKDWRVWSRGGGTSA